MKKVLVTGASGFVGRHLVEELCRLGYAVTSLVREASSLPNELILDLCDKGGGEIDELVHSVDQVVHLASHVDFSEQLSTRLFDVNTLSTFRLAKSCMRHSKRLIFSSGIFVHGSRAEFVNESTAENPDLPYSMSKWLAEKLIEELCEDATILRIGGIYGLNGPTHLGVNRAIEQALFQGAIPTIYGSGEGKRNYIYVLDLVQWIIYYIEKEINGVFYLAGEEEISIREMIEAVCEELLDGKPPVLEAGTDSKDQIIRISEERPTLHSFKEALVDIKQAFLTLTQTNNNL